MSGLNRIKMLADDIIKSGAKALYISDDNGLELLFVGDERFRPILQVLPSVYSWIIYQVEMKYMVSLRMKHNISVSCNGIPFLQLDLNMGGMKCIFVTYKGLSMGSVYPRDADVSSVQLIRVLHEISSILKFPGKTSFDVIKELKQYILDARKSISLMDRESLVKNLIQIKLCLDSINNPTLQRYSGYIGKLLEVLQRAELSEDIRVKAKRSLLSLYRNVIKILNQEFY